ncbi:MAG: DUF1122 family protein [Candidatus Aminicenantes bacterium]
MNRSTDLKKLHHTPLNHFRLNLGEVKQLRLSGWQGFKLYVENPQHLLSTEPVIEGIYSVGGKDGVKPWMDLNYREEVEFPQKKMSQEIFSLQKAGLDQKLYEVLGEIIPPGGHLMVSYEGGQKIHSETIKSLNMRIPPAVTPLGYLIFTAGFQYIKDWYLAEGGFEGPRKLWGEKAPDKNWAKIFLQRTSRQISQFLDKKTGSPLRNLEKEAVQKGEKILRINKFL